MAKKLVAQIKLQVSAGQATPSPPVGPALGQHGVNIMEFCKRFNAETGGKGQDGIKIPVVISVYNDRSFTFITKSPPAPILLKRAAMIAKGAADPKREEVGKVTRAQVAEIARIKLEDLNTTDVDAAFRIIAGTARSMGLSVVD